MRPLRTEHLLAVRDIYRRLKRTEPNRFGGLPIGTNWLRMEYLREDTIRTLATASMGDIPTLKIHPRAFEWNQTILLKGLVRHEMIHFVLGAGAGHGHLFRSIEEEWEHFEDYKHQRAKFVRVLEIAARDSGKLHRYECPNCRKVILKTRPLKPESACDDCCKNINNGVWSETYILIKVEYDERLTDTGEDYD